MPNRIAGHRNDRYGGRCLFESDHHPISKRQDKIRIASCDIAGELRVDIGTSLAGITLDNQVLSLYVAEPADFQEKLAPEPIAATFGQLGDRPQWMQYRDPVHLRRLLRPCAKR